MSEYIWIDAEQDGEFGESPNWLNALNGFPGVPGVNDVALVELSGSLTGSGDVASLLLIPSAGTLTIQSLNVTANALAMAGSVAITSGTQLSVTDNVVQTGTSSIVQSNGSYLGIVGNDGTAGDVVTAMTFGQTSTDLTAYTLTGLGTEMDASDGNMMIGGAGSATVMVANGAILEADNANNDGSGNITLGGTIGAQGTLTVTGAFSELELAGSLNVGAAGTGRFTLSGGAVAQLDQNFVPSINSIALAVGAEAGSTGIVTITGAGTRLDINNYGQVVVGGSGTGNLTIAAGASANFGALYLGEGGNGTVVIEGTGTTVEAHQAALVGYGAGGTLEVLSGAHFAVAATIPSALIAAGYLPGSSGKLLVSGAGSELIADNNQAVIGYYGTGSATISSGGTISTGAPSSSASQSAVFAGYAAGSVGTIVVENANSTWIARGDVDVGDYGKGTLLVESGGAVSSGNYNGVVGMVLGNQSGGSGTVTVTGVGSKITNSGHFIVGNYGIGTLTISAGATVATTTPSGSTVDGATIGGNTGGIGHVTVTGTGSTWAIGSDLVVGSAGAGTLTVGAGGTVSAGSILVAATGTGTVNLSGAAAALTVSGTAELGATGKAAISIGAGSVFSVSGTTELKQGVITMAGGKFMDTASLTIDALQRVTGFGTLQAAGFTNQGTVVANGGTLSFIGGMTGTGSLDIATGATLSLTGSVSSGQRAVFEAATGQLKLGLPAQFSGSIYDFVKGDTIDLASIAASSLTFSGHILTVHESGGATFGLTFGGSYTQASFAAPVSDGHGGTLIAHS
jgi:fibronectin-binding autotransporter adhesin